MKIYDKEMYQKEQWFKSVILVIGMFIIGFVVGYFVHNFEKQEEVTKLQEQVNLLQKEIEQISLL